MFVKFSIFLQEINQDAHCNLLITCFKMIWLKYKNLVATSMQIGLFLL